MLRRGKKDTRADLVALLNSTIWISIRITVIDENTFESKRNSRVASTIKNVDKKGRMKTRECLHRRMSARKGRRNDRKKPVFNISVITDSGNNLQGL